LPHPREGARFGLVSLNSFVPHFLYCSRWKSPNEGKTGKTWLEIQGLLQDWTGRMVSDLAQQGRL
jgi:hypothetical protein